MQNTSWFDWLSCTASFDEVNWSTSSKNPKGQFPGKQQAKVQGRRTQSEKENVETPQVKANKTCQRLASLLKDYHSLGSDSITTAVTALATATQVHQAHPNDLTYHVQIAENALVLAAVERKNKRQAISPQEKEKYAKKVLELTSFVYRKSLHAQIHSPLDPRGYYIESLEIDFHGVTCRSTFTPVEGSYKILFNLRLCMALSPQYAFVEEAIQKIGEFYKQCWTSYRERGKLSELNHRYNLQHLDELLTEDPLKKLFGSKPKLFDLAIDPRYTSLFERYPYLQNKRAFVTRYPNYTETLGVVGSIERGRQVNGQPHSEKVPHATYGIDISAYAKKRGDILSFKNILAPFMDKHVYLDMDNLSIQEAEAIRDMLLDNPQFEYRFKSPDDLTLIFMAFEKVRYEGKEMVDILTFTKPQDGRIDFYICKLKKLPLCEQLQIYKISQQSSSGILEQKGFFCSLQVAERLRMNNYMTKQQGQTGDAYHIKIQPSAVRVLNSGECLVLEEAIQQKKQQSGEWVIVDGVVWWIAKDASSPETIFLFSSQLKLSLNG
jgi:hypothetical protein